MKRMILIFLCVTSQVFAAYQTGGGLTLAPARAAMALDKPFLDKLTKDYQDALQKAEDKFKTMTKAEIVKFLEDAPQSMLTEFSESTSRRGFPVQMDQESFRQVYQDLAKVQQDFYVRLAIQALAFKYALMK